MDKIRVLIADDHAIVREGIGLLLARHKDIEVVGQATDGKQAIARVAELRPDIVLMDITMPEMSGLEATQEIHKKFPATRVLVLTQHENKEFIFPLLRAGAAGYVFKRARAQELIGAIRAVFAEGAYLPPEVAHAVVDALAQPASETRTGSLLSEREKEIVRLVAEGLSSREIGERLTISAKTVETHRANVMEKIGAHTTAELIKYAIREGLAKA